MNSSPVKVSTASSSTVRQPAQSEGESEYSSEHTRWAENAHRADETLWPDSVANPRRTRVR